MSRVRPSLRRGSLCSSGVPQGAEGARGAVWSSSGGGSGAIAYPMTSGAVYRGRRELRTLHQASFGAPAAGVSSPYFVPLAAADSGRFLETISTAASQCQSGRKFPRNSDDRPFDGGWRSSPPVQRESMRFEPRTSRLTISRFVRGVQRIVSSCRVVSI